MRQIWLDDEQFDIPEGITGRDLKPILKKKPDEIIYIPRGDYDEVIDDDKPVNLWDGQRIGSLLPFITGMEYQ